MLLAEFGRVLNPAIATSALRNHPSGHKLGQCLSYGDNRVGLLLFQ
jgi:hypothetical protein